ncbi:MAG: biotin--[acetyl-CoA-carboxylase] ligase [Rubrivivax sp.]|nr:biotin--[acetyl-CoA-carboxylase] ligase [Rubrivivax sp.]
MLDSQHLNWNAEALWQRLEPLLPGLSVEVLARADSTNTRLLDHARHAGSRVADGATQPGELPGASLRRRAADVQPCLLVAEQQTSGRGRMGRNWLSSPGASLTFSLSLPLALEDWSGLSLAVGLALAEALDPCAATALPRIHLKWPNDLWLLDAPGRGRKLGGILIETVSLGERRLCVVGVGLNVAPQAVQGLSHGFACLQELLPAITAPAVLERVAEPLVRELLRFQAGGFAPCAVAYARRDLLRGQAVTTTLDEVPQGVAEGVDERGALLVRDGGLHHVVSGEVSVRLRPG